MIEEPSPTPVMNCKSQSEGMWGKVEAFEMKADRNGGVEDVFDERVSHLRLIDS